MKATNSPSSFEVTTDSNGVVGHAGAVMLADGGDCLTDLAVLRDQPELFGPVASTPTAWRVVERLAQDPDGLARLRLARAHARGRAWAAGGDPTRAGLDRAGGAVRTVGVRVIRCQVRIW